MGENHTIWHDNNLPKKVTISWEREQFHRYFQRRRRHLVQAQVLVPGVTASLGLTTSPSAFGLHGREAERSYFATEPKTLAVRRDLERESTSRTPSCHRSGQGDSTINHHHRHHPSVGLTTSPSAFGLHGGNDPLD